MKKFQYIIALAAAFVGFTSCEDDKEPVYHEPTEFHLNTPPFANHHYELTDGGSIELTCSQPNYGYSAVTNYGIDVSLTGEFTTNEADGTSSFYHINADKSARMVISDKDLATAICTLSGIEDYANYPAEGLTVSPVYIRATANLSGVPSSAIISDETIQLASVTAFNPYREGGRVIYFVGDASAWSVGEANANEIYEPFTLTETAKGSNVYVGAFNIKPKSDGSGINFRFYTELGDWGKGSIGSSTDGNVNMLVNITKEPVEHNAVADGQGNWQIPGSWTEGYVTFTVDLNGLDTENPADSKIFVTMQAGNYDFSKMAFIYLVGAPSAWSVEDPNAEQIYANFKLYDYDDNGIYMGVFNVPAGSALFRFYTELGKWGDDGALPSIGAAPADGNTDITMTDGVYSGPCVHGKGNWQIPDWAGGKMKMTVNTVANTVVFEAVPEN